jgi:hypothetical protein
LVFRFNLLSISSQSLGFFSSSLLGERALSGCCPVFVSTRFALLGSCSLKSLLGSQKCLVPVLFPLKYQVFWRGLYHLDLHDTVLSGRGRDGVNGLMEAKDWVGAFKGECALVSFVHLHLCIFVKLLHFLLVLI